MKRINTLMSLFFIGLFMVSCSESTLEETLPTPTAIPAEKTDFFLEKGALMGIHFGVQRPNVSLVESRNFLRYTFFPSWKDLCPGSRVYYMRPDRGPRLGTEVFFWVFQDKAARNQYFPEKDFPTEAFEKRRAAVDWLYADTTFFKYFKFGWNTSGYSSDYEVIAIADSVDREWLQDDAALVFQHYQLKPEADSLAFIQFLEEEWMPNASYSKDREDQISAVLKITRGYQEGQYALLNVFSNLQSRDGAFPYEGKPQTDNQESNILASKLLSFLEPSSDGEGHYEVVY